MTADVAADLFSNSLHLVMLIVTAFVLPGMIVGLIVSVFQAATQINEQTLSFLPRLLVTLLTITLLGRWAFGTLMDFCVETFRRAAALVH
jgi:flagellar biosynthesis protein FliQ